MNPQSAAAPHIFLSLSREPSFNLAFEEWLLREGNPQSPVLFLFRNNPSVIVGRNQNPWRECALAALRNQAVPVLRRCSGGGAVYHDPGNCNYAMVGSRAGYRPQAHLELALSALQRLGVEARLSPRNDLLFNRLKIAGSAFALTGRTSLQHGTMLIASNLSRLRAALRPEPNLARAIQGRSVASTVSSVVNLADHYPGLTAEAFEHAVIEVFREVYAQAAITAEVEPRNANRRFPGWRKYREKYRDDKWIVGRSPAFSVDLRTAHPTGEINWRLCCRDGRLARVGIDPGRGLVPDWAKRLAASLSGTLFWPDHLRQTLAAAQAASSPAEAREIFKLRELLLAPPESPTP